jgi:hypothetical protein
MLTKNKEPESREAKSNLLPFYFKNHRVGKVHSKFNQGLNLQFEDVLIYVGCIGTPLSAFGMNLEQKKLKHILNSVKIDDMVVNKGNQFIFYSFDEIIKIYDTDLEEIDLKIPKIKCQIAEITDSALYQYLKNIEFEKSIGIDLDERSSRHLELLLKSDKMDSNLNLRIINFFAGRGKGLTPSGDDILLGFTLGLSLFGSFEVWRETLAATVTKESTTLISVAYLTALLHGYASEPCIRLVKLLDGTEVAQIEKTVEQVRSIGHTSGMDTLFGFLLGLKFLIHQWEG